QCIIEPALHEVEIFCAIVGKTRGSQDDRIRVRGERGESLYIVQPFRFCSKLIWLRVRRFEKITIAHSINPFAKSHRLRHRVRGDSLWDFNAAEQEARRNA